jgi:dUTP pyrophosphatase
MTKKTTKDPANDFYWTEEELEEFRNEPWDLSEEDWGLDMHDVELQVKLLHKGNEDQEFNSKVPVKAHDDDACYDVFAYIRHEEHGDPWFEIIKPGERRLIKTGISTALPSGWEIQVRPRSGLALKKGLTVLNTPGTIDASYRGELGVVLVNLGHVDEHIHHGDKIAQLKVSKVPAVQLTVVDELSDTVRGDKGYGSTGNR